jgi:hypothetical protein
MSVLKHVMMPIIVNFDVFSGLGDVESQNFSIKCSLSFSLLLFVILLCVCVCFFLLRVIYILKMKFLF